MMPIISLTHFSFNDNSNRFFSQTKYPSFQRQLNLYGFSRFAHGRDKGAYFHACFVRGKRALVRNMVRRKIKGTKVRRSLLPSEEPDFYEAHWEDSNNLTLVRKTQKTKEDKKTTKKQQMHTQSNHPSTQKHLSTGNEGVVDPPNGILPEVDLTLLEDHPLFLLDSLEGDQELCGHCVAV